MDGCEATMAIRASKHPDAQTIPIIACTANAFTEDIAATQNAGMNAHVSKPLDFKILEGLLGKLIAARPDRNMLHSQYAAVQTQMEGEVHAAQAQDQSQAPADPAQTPALAAQSQAPASDGPAPADPAATQAQTQASSAESQSNREQ